MATMASNTGASRPWVRRLQIAAIGLAALLLAATCLFLILEATWMKPRELPPEQAFLYGSTGCEIMPLQVFLVLPDLFPEHFQPGGPAAGDWVEQFGFIRGRAGVNEGLPQGFAISHRRPRSGSPSPTAFVGANCSLCHTSVIRRSAGDPGVFVPGMGSTSLDFIAWVDAVRSAILDDKRLTLRTITDAYERKTHQSVGPLDKLMIQAWLSNAG